MQSEAHGVRAALGIVRQTSRPWFCTGVDFPGAGEARGGARVFSLLFRQRSKACSRENVDVTVHLIGGTYELFRWKENRLDLSYVERTSLGHSERNEDCVGWP